ncbi:hypothetical protein U9M48_040337 [Paspalum notatum var. saurae]|uniref:Uncharacterized protein n=1 Tax=Paspalum notatum var. saurae TaxID=547442 RepID=A0AAQ3UN69_PASNO
MRCRAAAAPTHCSPHTTPPPLAIAPPPPPLHAPPPLACAGSTPPEPPRRAAPLPGHQPLIAGASLPGSSPLPAPPSPPAVPHRPAPLPDSSPSRCLPTRLPSLPSSSPPAAPPPPALLPDSSPGWRLPAGSPSPAGSDPLPGSFGSSTPRFVEQVESKYFFSNQCFNDLVQLIGDVLPQPHKLPNDMYQCKRLTKSLSMGYEKIDMCTNNCMLFWDDHKDEKKCLNYGKGRYVEVVNENGEKVYVKTRGVMAHPVDSDAWKGLDEFDPQFTKDARNIHFGLATNGFTPFNESTPSYSCWSVFAIPYNPPSMCMKYEFMFLCLIIPGPKHLGPKLNVMLQSLIKELKQLWIGVEAYDISLKQKFNLRAAYLWSIHDFLAGEKNAFRKDTVSYDEPPKRLSGQEIADQLASLKINKEKTAYEGFGKKHNWTHISGIWDLSYAKALKLLHNIDVMHQERNVAESVISTCMDFCDKIKDNVKARKDLAKICNRPTLELTASGGKPRAPFCLKPQERKEVLRWMKKIEISRWLRSEIETSREFEDQEA